MTVEYYALDTTTDSPDYTVEEYVLEAEQELDFDD